MATKSVPHVATYTKVSKAEATVSSIYGGYSLTTLQHKLQRERPRMEIVDFRVPVEGDTYIRREHMLILQTKTVDNTLAFANPRSPRLIVVEKIQQVRVIFENPVEVKTYLKKGDIYTLPDHEDLGKNFQGFYQASEAQRVNKEFGRCMRWTRREETY